ncbi:MAG: twin-arginine translocase subunit TatC [Bacteroidota bacterium]
MSFLDHLEELRWHIVRSIMAIVVGTIVAFVFTPLGVPEYHFCSCPH